jgi:hypothetical protein
VALIAPAVTKTRLEHAAGNADEARVEAEGRIDDSMPALAAEGIEADPAAVGDQDPVTAIEDALREFRGLDEVVLVTNSGAAERWAEQDAFDRVRRRVGVPVTHLEVSDEGGIVERERSDPGVDPAPEKEIEGGGENLPPFTVRDALAIVVAIVGTIVLGLIAAHDINASNDPESTGGLGFGGVLTALLAVGFFIINVWHFVALTVFESIGYRGTLGDFFARLSLYGTPVAIVIALLVS